MKRNRIRLSIKGLIALLLFLAMLIPLTGYTSDLDEELINAARDGNTETVKALLAKGADVNAKDSLGYSALFCAAKGSHVDTLQALADEGADVNAKDMLGNTPLMWAAFQGRTETVHALLANRNCACPTSQGCRRECEK